MQDNGENRGHCTDQKLMETLAALGRRHENSLRLLSAIASLSAVPVRDASLKKAVVHALDILVHELNGIANCSVFVYKPEDDRLELLAARGPADVLGMERSYNADLWFEPGRGVAGRVFRDNRPEFWRRDCDPPEALDAGEEKNKPESLACLPLNAPDRVFGVLNISFLSNAPFDHSRRRDLIILGGVVTNVLYSVILRNQVEKTVLTCRREIDERDRAKCALAVSLKEKNVLLAEIRRRVKNNMQVVSNLLGLLARTVKDHSAHHAFQEGRTRVMTMSLIHDILYQSANLADISMEAYIAKLAEGILRTDGGETQHVTLEVRSDAIELGLDYAVPFGLVVSELVANAYRHAFPEDRGGKVSIDVGRLRDNGIRLVVADDGIGMPDGPNWKTKEGLGLQLVVDLVERQLGGVIELDTAEGSRFTVTFKQGEYDNRP